MEFKIPIAEPVIGEEELKLVTEAVKSGWVSSKGKYIEEFERGFSKYIGTKYGVAVSNGTAALHLALVALGIGAGDEVLIPTLTFASVANVVIYTGARPVFVDSHPDYWCIDPDVIERKITEKAKAIIAVHSYGHPCDMDRILEISNKYGLYVIEDCAEAHGAEYKGRKVGSFGDVACFSFYGNKIITTGEGGICLTNDPELAEKIRILRDHGMNPKKRYWHEVVGFNYRMTNLQAALGVAQLEKIDYFVARKRKITEIYNSLFENVEAVIRPPEMPWAKNVYWLYSILIDRSKTNMDRDKLMEMLSQTGIETRPLFYPIHEMPPYRSYSQSRYPVAERISRIGLSLPSSVKLTDTNIEFIANLIIRLLQAPK
jgi:perosamine synthetase